jgi:hypothetical protein
MKHVIAVALTAALALVMLTVAPPAHAAQTITFTVDLGTNCATTPSGGSLTLRAGESLAITVVATGVSPAGGACSVFLSAAPNLLTGWSSPTRSFDAVTGVFGGDISTAGTYNLDPLTVGTVSARLSVASFLATVEVPNTNSPVNLIVVERSGATTEGPIVLPPVEHRLGFDANGGTCTLTNSGPIIDGVWIKVPDEEQCTRPGYTLLGWNPKPDGSDPLGFDPGGWTLMTDDNTLYAIWVPVR